MVVPLIIFGGLGAAVLVIMMFGRCFGEEFSPHNFARRHFLYFRVPLVKLQVTPVYRSNGNNALVVHLQSNKFVASTGKNWQLLSLRAGVANPYEADPMILCRYLDQRNAKHDLAWLQWSSKHPELSSVFWPFVVQAARAGLYVAIPDLFETARAATKPEDLSLALHQKLAASTLALARGQYQLAAYEEAIQSCSFVLATLGLEDMPARNGEKGEFGVGGQITPRAIKIESNPPLADLAVNSLRLRSRTFAKRKKLVQAAADRKRIAELEADVSLGASELEHEGSAAATTGSKSEKAMTGRRDL